MIKIIADENLREIQTLCSSWSDVSFVPSEELIRSNLIDQDILIVRSNTKVDHSLINNTNIKFVGTPTSGINHIDLHYLEKNNISFSYAPGCNSNSVVDYVMSTLCTLFPIKKMNTIKVGIVGFGNIGSKLAKCLSRFEIDYKFFDPFIKCNKTIHQCHSLYELSDCDVVTIHTPYTTEGSNPTFQMINKTFLNLLRKDVTIINTSRGEVLNENHLIDFFQINNDIKVILDVWQNEPQLNKKLLSLSKFATPHIAGHSARAKINGLYKVINDLQKHYLNDHHPFEDNSSSINFSNFDNLDKYINQLRHIYQIKNDSENFKKLYKEKKSISSSFQYFRKNYPFRDEINYE